MTFDEAVDFLKSQGGGLVGAWVDPKTKDTRFFVQTNSEAKSVCEALATAAQHCHHWGDQ